MLVEVITPEQRIFSGEAVAVQLPGADGLFQVLDQHAPIISTLVEGDVKIDLTKAPDANFNDLEGKIVRVKGSDKTLRIPIKGGVMEMNQNKVIVLAD